MASTFKTIPANFASAEAGTIVIGQYPAIILSLETLNGPFAEYCLPLQDARECVVKLCESLAAHGDPTAKEIGQRYFGG